MPDEAAPVVSAEAEAPVDAGTPSDQTEEAAEESTQQEQPAPTDWRATINQNADLQALIKEEANRLFQKDRDRQRKAETRRLAQEAANSPDESTRVARAAELAKRLAEEEDPEEQANKAFVQRAQEADKTLTRLRATTEYAEVWDKHGKSEMDRRWHESPEEFADWMMDQIVEIRANKRARTQARDMSKAQAEDMTNERLRNVATPMSGSSGAGGGMTLDRLFSLSQAEAYQWKKANPSAYDTLVREAATAQ